MMKLILLSTKRRSNVLRNGIFLNKKKFNDKVERDGNDENVWTSLIQSHGKLEIAFVLKFRFI